MAAMTPEKSSAPVEDQAAVVAPVVTWVAAFTVMSTVWSMPLDADSTVTDDQPPAASDTVSAMLSDPATASTTELPAGAASDSDSAVAALAKPAESSSSTDQGEIPDTS